MKNHRVFIVLIVAVVFGIAPNAYTQDICSQLRSGWREIENEKSQLCSKDMSTMATCKFLETMGESLNKCKGDDCISIGVIAVTGCAMLTYESCMLVSNRFADFQKHSQKIQGLAKEKNCLLF